MTLEEFFTSLHHTEFANERIGYWQYFMHEKGDEVVAEFLRDVLSTVGETIDDGDSLHVIDCIKRWDQRYADWFIDDFQYSKQVVNEDTPRTMLAKPLAECRIMLISSAGFAKEDDVPHGPGETPVEQAMAWRDYFESHPTYRTIPKDYPRDKIKIQHPSYDQTAVRRDINVLYPLDRFQELEDEGVIGELAPVNLSYMGLTSNRRVEQELVPSLVAEIRKQEIDAAFLVPG